jgi:crotonobetainyl-CoA:carnitine CoA-transferase CaiB-like acyl-CoA transferase
VLAALWARDGPGGSGAGARVDVAMLDVMAVQVLYHNTGHCIWRFRIGPLDSSSSPRRTVQLGGIVGRFKCGDRRLNARDPPL